MTLPESDQEIIRYLLNEMEEQELSMMEEQVIQDAAFFDLVAAVEDEMIMQYVRGDMQGRLKTRFEQVYLGSTERRARVESARELRAAVREVAASRRPGRGFWPPMPRLRLQLIFAVLIVGVAAIVWPLWKSGFFGGKGQPLVQVQQTVAISLSPGLLRSGAGVQISMPRGTSQLEFHLAVAGLPVYESYQVVLGTPERPGVFTGPAAPKGSLMIATVPCTALTAGDYTLQLQGVASSGDPKPIGTYFFRLSD